MTPRSPLSFSTAWRSRSWARLLGRCALVLLAGQALAGTASAQDYFDRYRPKEPLRPLPPAEESSARSAGGGKLQSDQGPPLAGVVIVASKDEIRKKGRPKDKGITISGISDVPVAGLRKRLEPFLGQPLSLEKLKEVTGVIVTYYKDNNLPVVDASLPPQELKGNVVQILVTVGRLGDVRVEGNKWFSTQSIAGGITLRKGEPIDGERMLSDLAWENANPFRSTEFSLAKGAQYGESDLVLKTRDRFPLRGFAGYEDTGTPTTGLDRWFAGFNWGDVFCLGHQLNYQFTTSSDFHELTAHSASYIAPLPWHHTVVAYGTYTASNADTGDAAVNLEGYSWEAGTRYNIPIRGFDFGSVRLTQSAALGFSFKQTNNNLEFGGEQVFNTLVDIVEFSGNYAATETDPFGVTSFDCSLFHGVPGWTDNDKTYNYQQARADSEPDFWYARIGMIRSTRLPWNFSLLTSATVQQASGPLQAVEQIGVGGYNTVRGYDERAANGDNGYYINVELRTPPMSPLAWCGVTQVKDQLQLLAFFDTGGVTNYSLLPGQDPHVDLRSVGVGARYVVNPYMSVRFDYGWQMIDTGLPDTTGGSRGHLGVVFSY